MVTADLAIEPKNEIITSLRARLTDYNSGSRDGEQWILPFFPSLNLKKNSYPRISVTEISETGEIINVNRDMVYHSRCQIDVWVWQGLDSSDTMILIISSTNYQGQKLLDLIARDIRNSLDTNKSDFDDDTNKLHNYKLLSAVDMGPDPDRPQVIRKRIDVEFDYFR